MLRKRLLVTRPEHDKVTHYLSLWSGKVIDECEDDSEEIFDLRKEKVTKKNFESYSAKKKPDVFFLNGHGDRKTVCGHKDKPILRKDDNEDVTKNGIVYARSCDSANELGPSCVKNGTKAFIGYDRPFVFLDSTYSSSKPLEDRCAELIFEASNTVIGSLMRGKTPQEAYEESQRIYKKNKRKVLTDDFYSLEAYFILTCLAHNMEAQTIVNDKTI